MGFGNFKFETEVFQQIPQFQIPNQTPVETKPDWTALATLVSQVQQLQLAVSQIHQVVVQGQSFTQAAGLPQAAGGAAAKLRGSKKAAAGG